MLTELRQFYNDYADALKFKGNQPGQDPNSKVAELALVGDAFLKLAVMRQLVMRGWGNSEATIAGGKFLSNSFLSEIATKAEIPTGISIHSNGTLLEAMVGYWHLAQFISTQRSLEVFRDGEPAFNDLVDYITDQCIIHAKRDSMEGLY